MGWVIAALVVVAIAVLLYRMASRRLREADRQQQEWALAQQKERDRQEREATARLSELALAVLGRLPVEARDSSPLLHEPVYDCSSDVFELPCANPAFDGDSGAEHGPHGIGWFTSAVAVRRAVERRLAGRAEAIAVCDGGRYLAIACADSPASPGATVWRLVRTGQEEWYCWWYRSGMRPSATGEDPPFTIAQLQADAGLLERLREGATEACRANGDFRYALRQCQHAGREQPAK